MTDDDYEIPDAVPEPPPEPKPPPAPLEFPEPEVRDGVPADPLAERAVLAAVLVNPVDAWPWASTLDPEAFHRPAHRAVFEAMQRLERRGEAYGDALTVRDEVVASGSLQPKAVDRVLATLMASYVKSINVEHHAALLRRSQRRRSILADSVALARAASRADDAELQAATAAASERWQSLRSGAVAPTDLLSAAPTHPEWIVRDLIPRTGTVMLWAPPNAGKTYLMLRTVWDLMGEPQAPTLWGHPRLPVEGNVRRVLWVATEETAGRIRSRADRVQAGLDGLELAGDLVHVFAADTAAPVTLDDLPGILARHGPFDVVILDSLTGLRPKSVDGRRVQWDVDNDAANEICLRLRGLAERHQAAIVIVHHSAKDGTNYRGPTDWWASVDVMFGLEPDPRTSTLKVIPQKNRDGVVLDTFRLMPTWGETTYAVEYIEATSMPLTAKQQAVVDAMQRMGGRTSQATLTEVVGGGRRHLRGAIEALIERDIARWTGEVDGRSAVLELIKAVEEL